MENVSWRPVARDADLVEGVPVLVTIGEEKIVLARVEGQVHAFDHKCPHYEEPLEQGVLLGREIICSRHCMRADVTTGRMTSAPGLNDLTLYPVKVDAGQVFVGEAVKPRFPKPTAAIGSDPRTFLIVGAGAAGNAAAEGLRRAGFAGRIVLVGSDPDRPYDRPNLSKDYITGKATRAWLPLRGEKFYGNQSIELMTSRTVTRLDPRARKAFLDDGQSISFDRALLATGGVPRKLPVPGADLPGCYTLRTTADADAILAAAGTSKSAVLIGAGFIGMELASSLRQLGLAVCVIAPEPLPLANVLGDRIALYLQGLHESRGVIFRLGKTVQRISGAPGAMQVTLSDGMVQDAGFVVIGVGITPAVDWLSGTDLVEGGAVPVDDRLQTRAQGVFAAGDIAAVKDPVWGTRRVEHWVEAERQGFRAALCMLDRDPGPWDGIFFWTKQAGISVRYAGYARQFDQVVYRGVVEQGKFLAGYYVQGKLRAACTVGKAAELIAVDRFLTSGAELPPSVFADEGFDLLEAARKVPARRT